jgi:hypothetical protein
LKDASSSAGAAKSSAKEAASAATDAKNAFADAKKLAQEAQKEADSAERDLVSEKELSVKLENDLAAALQRTARLEQQLSWRTVTPEQTTKIKDFIVSSRTLTSWPFRGTRIGISHPSNNPEAEEYANELAIALRHALDGFGVEIPEPTAEMTIWTGQEPQGIILEVNRDNDPEASLLQQALSKAGIDAPGKITPSLQSGVVNLMVLAKPQSKPKD